MSNIKLSENIVVFRKAKGITQEQLANHLGVTNQSVSKWESGRCYPDIELLPELAHYFEISVDELLGSETATKPVVPEKNQDSLMAQAIEIAKESRKISSSLLQRALGIGYGRAQAILQDMVEGGYVAKDDSKKYSAYIWMM